MALEGEMVDAAPTAAERGMTMIKCKYEGTGIWNGRCVGTKEVDPCPGYDNCKQYKPNYTTNADRIRAMSDEELGVWICEHALSCGCCVGVELCRSDDGIANGAVKWLQQPAEGE